MICGTLTAGTQGFDGGAVAGICVLYAPFSIFGGADAMGADSLTDTTEMVSSLSLAGLVAVPADFSVPVSGLCLFVCPLSAMDGDLAESVLPLPLCVDGNCKLLSSMPDMSAGLAELCTVIGDCGFCGDFSIPVPFGHTDVSGMVSLPADSSLSFVSQDTLAVYADGVDVTRYLTSAKIILLNKNALPSVSAVFAAGCGIVPSVLTFTVSGEDFTFDVASAGKASDGTVISGVMHGPSGDITTDVCGIPASSLATDSGRIVWAAADHVAGRISGKFSHYALAAKLASDAGRIVRLLPDGFIVVSGGGTDITIRPEHIFEYETAPASPGHSLVRVFYGHDDGVVIAETKSAENTAFFRVYGYGGEAVITEAEDMSRTGSCIQETVAEWIYFSDGTANTSKPVRRMLTDGVSSDGRTLSIAGVTGWVFVSYMSSYDRYSVTDRQQSKRSLALVSGNFAEYKTVADGTVKTVKNSCLCDRVTACGLAKSLAADKAVTTFVTSHNAPLTTAAGLRFCGAGIYGTVISAKISIKNEPLMIKNILEVRHD